MAKDNKSNIVAGLLAIFLGIFGVHEFYLGNIGRGLTYLLLTIVGFLLSLFFIGLIFLTIIEIIAFIQGVVLLCSKESFNRKYNLN